MNSKLFFIILLVLIGAVVFGLTTKPKQKLSTTTSAKAESSDQSSTLASQTKTMGSVEVEVTPASIVSGKGIVFELSLDTHSVELNYDYTQIAVLTDDRGNSYQPTQWNGGSSGHHLQGELIFEPLSENPNQLTLTLEGIDNKSEAFTWQL
jgi:hypothetical protein